MNKRQFLTLGALVAYFVALSSYSISHAQTPRTHGLYHLALTHGNGAVVLEMWCDELAISSDAKSVLCKYNGDVVLRVPHASGFQWTPLEEK